MDLQLTSTAEWDGHLDLVNRIDVLPHLHLLKHHHLPTSPSIRYPSHTNHPILRSLEPDWKVKIIYWTSPGARHEVVGAIPQQSCLKLSFVTLFGLFVFDVCSR